MQSTAKQRYQVTDNDLKKLGNLKKTNPHKKNWQPMNLYLESQVKHIAYERHGNEEGIEKHARSILDKKLQARLKVGLYLMNFYHSCSKYPFLAFTKRIFIQTHLDHTYSLQKRELEKAQSDKHTERLQKIKKEICEDHHISHATVDEEDTEEI